MSRCKKVPFGWMVLCIAICYSKVTYLRLAGYWLVYSVWFVILSFENKFLTFLFVSLKSLINDLDANTHLYLLWKDNIICSAHSLFKKTILFWFYLKVKKFPTHNFTSNRHKYHYDVCQFGWYQAAFRKNLLIWTFFKKWVINLRI